MESSQKLPNHKKSKCQHQQLTLDQHLYNQFYPQHYLNIVIRNKKNFRFLMTMIWRYSITINILAPWKQYLLSPIPHESFYRKHDTNLTMMALNWKCFEKWDSWQFPYSQLVLQLLKLLILIFCEVRCINVIALQIWYRRFFHKQSSSW